MFVFQQETVLKICGEIKRISYTHARARQRMEQGNWEILNALYHNNQPITATVEFQILRCYTVHCDTMTTM